MGAWTGSQVLIAAEGERTARLPPVGQQHDLPGLCVTVHVYLEVELGLLHERAGLVRAGVSALCVTHSKKAC